MKHQRITPEEAAAMARRDRNKLILMTAAVVLLGIGYFVTRYFSGSIVEREAREQLSHLPAEFEERVSVLAFDRWDVLEGVRDARPEDRVLQDSEPLDVLLDYARLLGAQHYRALAIRDLTPEALAELRADPAAQRAEPFRARGTLESLRPRQREGKPYTEHVGTLRLEDGSWAHFVALEVPGDVAPGSFVRMDGLFLKLFSTEGADGWREGPLLLGQQLHPSIATTRLEPEERASILAEVRDDQLEPSGEATVSGIPYEAKWALLELASRPDAPTDWEAAPELDSELLAKIFTDGEAYRGQPFRLPISTNVGTTIVAAGENPLRIERLTSGWIGNMVWKGNAGAIHYFLPGEHPELADWKGAGRLVTGRGYFLKNWMYSRVDGKPGRVPVFMMERVEPFTPVVDERPVLIMYGVLGGTVVLALVIWALLMRDRRESKALQEELVRRRRARRSRTTASSGGA